MSDIIEIELSKGYVTSISKCDEEFVKQWKWSASDNSRPWHSVKKVYAVRCARVDKKNKRLYLHREIMRRILSESGVNPTDEMLKKVVDHGDGNSLNNTRENLWLCDHAANNEASQKNNAENAVRDSKGKFKSPPGGRRHRRTVSDQIDALANGEAEWNLTEEEIANGSGSNDVP